MFLISPAVAFKLDGFHTPQWIMQQCSWNVSERMQRVYRICSDPLFPFTGQPFFSCAIITWNVFILSTFLIARLLLLETTIITVIVTDVSARSREHRGRNHFLCFVLIKYNQYSPTSQQQSIHLGLKYFRFVDPSPHQLFPGDQCGPRSSTCRPNPPVGTSLQSQRDLKPPSQPPDLTDHSPGTTQVYHRCVLTFCSSEKTWIQESSEACPSGGEKIV